MENIEINNESLYKTFIFFIHKYAKNISEASVLTGIPVKYGQKIPEMLSFSGGKSNISLMAKRCGMRTKLIDKNPADINPDAFPLIGFDKSGMSFVIEYNTDGTFTRTAESGSSERLSQAELRDSFLTSALLLKKELIKSDDTKKDKKWFFEALWLSRWIYADVLAASLFINLFGIVTPLFTMNVYDRIVPNHAVESLWALSAGIVIVFIFDFVLKYLRHHFLEISAKKTDMLLSGKLFKKVMDLGMKDRPKVIGSFASNIKDFDMIRNFMSSSSISVFVDFPFMIIFLLLISYIAGFIVLIPIAINIITLVYAFIIKRPMQNLVQENYTISSHKNGMLIESLKMIETIKSFNFHKYKMWEWDETVAKAADHSKKLKSYSYTLNTFFNFMVNLNTVLIVIAGVYLIADLRLTTGGLIASVMLGSRTVAPLGQFISLIITYEQAKVAYEGIDNIMQKDSEIFGKDTFVDIPDFKGDIVFNNVSFKYFEEGNYALQNVSLHIKAGEKVAVLGKMGSGKTTLQKLLLGFYKPTDGEILLDGINVSQINPVALRDTIAYVPQNVELFRGTLKDNIVLRNTGAEDSEIINALNTACLGGFISRHPRGIAAEIDEDGHNLSGGQKQSITIARAFIGKSRIALLDEPTDGIDFNTEAQIISNLQTALKDKTVFLITHKNNLLKMVDRVIVLDEGRVVFDGAKEDMFRKFTEKVS
ncbi:MAG: type I secretion system permease/ATPase [Deferribacterales bacterium]